MRITGVNVEIFSTPSRRAQDSAGHAHPGDEVMIKMALLRISCDDGSEGYAFGTPELIRPHIIESFVRKVLIGRDPMDRESIWQDLAHWQRGSAGQFTDRALALVEQALWDLAGRKLKLPVHKLIGGYRDKVLAYGSTMCGDDLPGGLSTPDEYGQFAEKLVKRGYKAIKLHTWMPPISFAPNPQMDIQACAAVREAVGPDIALMLDGYHWYSRMDALTIGKALEKLNFAWFEEPMMEDSAESYAWLAANLDIPVLGPESIAGKFHSRASWVTQKSCDILRAGVAGVGGIGPCLKVAHLAESFGMDCEVHGNGAANLAVVGAISNCRWYERGLLHPFLDYEEVPAHLNSLVDPMDADGYVHLSDRPGLGEDINFAYIEANTLSRH
ncbi:MULTISPECIES: mandelate racemase family protein [Pseudomonas]|jgi:L-alanine-DL-glutamate epimerase-like enolase superfamily enzyme|uniref:Mandelate racemase family protein n=1 Tax=Pseudomonas canavaninivorans TaxID=2842348 RepID=A0ABX8QBB2_PSECO|nr:MULTISPECIES: mandelate racemase family protein [Pseudomonas]MBJ2346162.1 mandelate racemase family protein [Pseudomonas canavaninivorans]MBL3544235.1 mandelate racemase family protein [Pseudomonas sp. HB05]QXI52575.1 mandelate racemase family protein [Pseudomonas alvandae]UVM71593.1 mandelate racemase family protein [Pseudomonas canavaninivorans]